MIGKILEVVVSVRDRGALPVRAIPFATGWRVSSDTLANGFAQNTVDDQLVLPRNAGGEASDTCLPPVLPTYLLADDGAVHKLLPRDWDAPAAAIAALVADTSYEPDNEPARYVRYRRQSIALLPAGVFVWQDEFESLYVRAMRRTLIANERPDDRLLELRPLVPADLHAVVMEGFIVSGKSARGMAADAMKMRAQAACRAIVAGKTSLTFREIVENPAFTLAVNGGKPGSIPVSEKTLRSWIQEVYSRKPKGGRPKGSRNAKT